MAGKKKSKHDRAKDSGKKSAKSAAAKNTSTEKPVARAAEPTAVVASNVEAARDGGSNVATVTAEPARRGPLTEMVPVRFDAQMLADVRARAADDHRSVSSWIRRAVDVELHRGS
jgi:hypothetical protein